MKAKRQPRLRTAAVIALLLLATTHVNAFTYQGVLSDNGTNAQGQYELTFQLLLAGTTTTAGAPITLPVTITDGLFAVDLPFDPLLFDGTAYDLQISARNQGGPIFVLSPPTPLAPTPQSLFANSVGSVPDSALAGNVARLDQPAVFLTSVSMPVLRVSDATGSGRLLFGPTDDCTVGIDPSIAPGLLLRDVNGVRVSNPTPGGANRLIFGDDPDDLCMIAVDSSIAPGLLLRDPGGVRVTNPTPGGANRLIFGDDPDDLCMIAVDSSIAPGLLLRDPGGIRILPAVAPGSPPAAARVIFGPTDDCSIGIDPTRQGLRVAENYGLRLNGDSGLGDRVIFGPTDDCTIGIDPTRQGLRVAENYGLRLNGNSGTGDRVIFGPTDDCTIGIDPTRQGLRVAENYGLRLNGNSGTGDRVIFGPTDDCTIGIDPTRQGLRVAENYGLRLYGDSGTGDRVIFGPTDDCTIGIDPTGVDTGLVVYENVGLRLTSANPGGVSRLMFGPGPTDDCSIIVDPDPTGIQGMQLLEQHGVRIRNPLPGGVARLSFGNNPDNNCAIEVNPGPTGIRGMKILEEIGVTILNPTGGASRLSFGDDPDNLCTIAVDPAGPGGLQLRDPSGIRILSPVPTSPPRLIWGPTDDCTISVIDPGTGAGPRMTLEDANGFLFTNDVEVQGGVTAQAFIQQSTRRLKDNIKPLENALELIQQLQGVRYDWKPEKGGQADIGFIAEEVGKVFPEVVEWEKDGINARGVNYGHLVAVAMEGIKAQQAEIDTLRNEKADVERRLARLEALLLSNTQAGE